jgi:hypothetical protein
VITAARFRDHEKRNHANLWLLGFLASRLLGLNPCLVEEGSQGTLSAEDLQLLRKKVSMRKSENHGGQGGRDSTGQVQTQALEGRIASLAGIPTPYSVLSIAYILPQGRVPKNKKAPSHR